MIFESADFYDLCKEMVFIVETGFSPVLFCPAKPLYLFPTSIVFLPLLYSQLRYAIRHGAITSQRVIDYEYLSHARLRWRLLINKITT